MADQRFRVKNGLEVGPSGSIFIVKDSINVGIGDYNPSSTLVVNAPSAYAGNILDLQVNGISAYTFAAPSTGYGFLIATSPNGFALQHRATTVCTIHDDRGLAIFSTTGGLGFGASLGGGVDLQLYRDSANVLAQRNSTNAQTSRIYNTYTSTTNFERANIGWTTNTFIVGTEKGSAGGTARQMEFQTDGTTRAIITTTGALNIVGAGTAGSTQAVSFNGSAPVNSLVIDSTGQSGFGTASPGAKVDVIGTLRVSSAATQDGIILQGRAGGTSSFEVTISPTTLTADRTLTLADGNTTLVAGTMATTGGTLAQFSATTSSQLLGVISDETGTGALVFANTPTLVTPVLGAATGTSLNLSGTASDTLRLSGLYTSTQTNPSNNSNTGFLSLGPSLTFNDTDKLATFVGDVNSYNQFILQNKNAGTAASSDFVVNNDRVGGTAIYGDYGINSSAFTGGGAFGDIDGTYLYGAGGTLAVGTLGANDFRVATNNTNRLWVLSTGNFGVGVASPTASLHLKAGTATASTAPLKLTSGTNLTTAEAGAIEYDGAVGYLTPDATIGRGFIPATSTFRLTAAGGAINQTIANFFGANSNIPLVANAFYEIDIYMLGLKGSTAGAVTWTLTNSAAPTSMFVDYEQSPLAGIAAPPGSVTALTNLNFRGSTTTTTAAYTFNTGSLAASVTHYFRFKLLLRNGAGTSLKIQLTAAAGNASVTPQANSVWFARRLPDANTGSFAA